MRRFGTALASGLGGLFALIPAAALAAEGEASRALERPEAAITVILYTLGVLGAAMLVAALGWLYQQKRGLHWTFQDADSGSHGDNSHH